MWVRRVRQGGGVGSLPRQQQLACQPGAPGWRHKGSGPPRGSHRHRPAREGHKGPAAGSLLLLSRLLGRAAASALDAQNLLGAAILEEVAGLEACSRRTVRVGTFAQPEGA